MTPEESHVCRNQSEKSTTPEELNVIKLIDDAMRQPCAAPDEAWRIGHQSIRKHISIKYISQWYDLTGFNFFYLNFATLHFFKRH